VNSFVPFFLARFFFENAQIDQLGLALVKAITALLLTDILRLDLQLVSSAVVREHAVLECAFEVTRGLLDLHIIELVIVILKVHCVQHCELDHGEI
jgi:hypothetical protein